MAGHAVVGEHQVFQLITLCLRLLREAQKSDNQGGRNANRMHRSGMET
jgi:hypothetical protein